MRKKLDEQLCKDFPILYRDRNAPKQISNMRFGFPCDGWEPLIRDLSKKLEKHNKKHPENQIIAAQVKQKFGQLRFYVKENPPKYIRNLISNAERKSENICMDCGNENAKKRKGYSFMLRTLCDKCMLGMK